MFCVCCDVVCFFFFKQKTAYEMRISDGSSDVCSSDLRMDDLMRFVRAVYDEDVNVDDPRVGHVCTAIEGAAARWLARKGGNSMRDIFGGASKMQESLTFLGAVGRAHPSSASGLPLPVAVRSEEHTSELQSLMRHSYAV